LRRPGLRPLAYALPAVASEATPATPLARVQARWAEVAGAAVAAESTPVAEHAGTVTVACRSAVWAHELELLSAELVERLNAGLAAPVVRGFRFVTTSPRSDL
jgi:predicted nucleic acid-binding Zn ribbon protein